MKISNQSGNQIDESQKYFTKIPFPIKSPKYMRLIRSKSNNIVCSTPLKGLKENDFQNENQQLSPIIKSSSDNLISDKVLVEENLNSLPDKQEDKNIITLKSQTYQFPLVNYFKRQNMKICDSEEELEVQKKNQNKKKLAVKGVTQIAKTSKSENHIEQNRNTIKTRSISYADNVKNEINSCPKLTENSKVFVSGEVELICSNSKNKKDFRNDKTRNSVSYNENANKTQKSNADGDNKIDNITIVSPIDNLGNKHNNKNILEVTEEKETNLDFVEEKNNFSQLKESESDGNLKENVEILQIINNKKQSNVKSKKMDRNIKLNKGHSFTGSDNTKQIKSEKKIRKNKTSSMPDQDLARRSGRIREPSSYATWLMDMKQLQASMKDDKKKRSKRSITNKMIKKPPEQIICEENVDTKSQILVKPEIRDIKSMEILSENQKSFEQVPCEEGMNFKSQFFVESETKDIKPAKISEEIPIVDPIIVNLPKESGDSSANNKEQPKSRRKIKKFVYTKRKMKCGSKKVKKQNKTQVIEKPTVFTSENESFISPDTLLTHKERNEKHPSIASEKTRKRKGSSTHVDLYQSKKVRLENEFDFKSMAQALDIAPLKATGLVDVEVDGKCSAISCFGRFPRELSGNFKNPDVSVGISINNALITTGILEIEPQGRKKYEYAKKSDLIFIVLQGTAEIGIQNSSKVLRLGQDFFIPRNTPYYIINVSTTEKLLLHFSKF